MRISVIIPTFNRRHLLARTLPSVLEQDIPSDQYEVIVVVDGSTDGTTELLKALEPKCAFKIVALPQRGIAAAKNAGLRAASGEIVLFLDDDVVCEPALVQEHLRAHSAGETIHAFGPVLASPGSSPTLAADWMKTILAEYFDELFRGRDPDWQNDLTIEVNHSLPRALLLQFGGYDESFRGLGSSAQEFGFRLQKSGIKVRFVAGALARQIYVKTTRELVGGEARAYGQNRWDFCLKHPETRATTVLASVGYGGAVRRLIRQGLARMPVSPDLAFRFPLWFLERFRQWPAARAAGVSLTRRAHTAMQLWAAVRRAGSWRALAAVFGARMPVLTYHNVGPYRPGTERALTVSPERFRRQMLWLAGHGYTGISAAQWVEWRERATPLPEKPVLLSFDEAYEDIAEHALPLVRELGFRATVFVTTGSIGRTNKWNQAPGWRALRVMSEEQVLNWAREGIEFGSHSRTHPILTTLDEALLEEEIGGSRKDLAELLGAAPLSFAYPYGDTNAKVRKCAAGHYRAAFTFDEGINTIQTDPAALRRTIILSEDSKVGLVFRLRMGRNPLQHFRARLTPAVMKRARSLFGRAPKKTSDFG